MASGSPRSFLRDGEQPGGLAINFHKVGGAKGHQAGHAHDARIQQCDAAAGHRAERLAQDLGDPPPGGTAIDLENADNPPIEPVQLARGCQHDHVPDYAASLRSLPNWLAVVVVFAPLNDNNCE